MLSPLPSLRFQHFLLCLRGINIQVDIKPAGIFQIITRPVRLGWKSLFYYSAGALLGDGSCSEPLGRCCSIPDEPGKVTLHRSTSHPSPCVIKCKVAQLTLSLPLTFTLSFLLYFLFLVFIFLCRFLPKTVAEKG